MNFFDEIRKKYSLVKVDAAEAGHLVVAMELD